MENKVRVELSGDGIEGFRDFATKGEALYWANDVCLLINEKREKKEYEQVDIS